MNELATINSALELHSTVLSSMRERLIPQRNKAASEVEKLGNKADSIVQQYNRAVALELAALPVNDKGKLDEAAFDGFKTPIEVAMNVFGFKKQNAYDLFNAGKVYLNDKEPEELRKMTPSNLAAFLRADGKEARKALSDGTITAKSTQAELKAFADAHKPTTTKSGKPKVVTTFKAYRGGEMESVPAFEGFTEAEFIETLKGGSGVLAVHKVDEYKLSPADAPKLTLTARRYVVVYEDLSAMVYTIIPQYKPMETEQSSADRAIIARFMDRHPGVTEAEARETLEELGML